MAHRLSLLALVTIAASSLALGQPAPANAAGGPTGTITCDVFSDENPQHPKGILFRPFIDSEPRNLGIAVTNVGSSCDASGVTGGKAPITGVAFKLTARLPDGDCAALTSPAPNFRNGRVVLKWRGVNPTGKLMTVSKSSAHITSAAYDTGSHTLSFTTEPLKGPAFAGKTATINLGFDYFADVIEAGCDDTNGFIAQGFGNVVPSSVEVQ